MTAAMLFALSLSVAFPLIVGILRWHSVRDYRPMCVLFCLAAIAEIVTRCALRTGDFNWIPGNNLYILAESMLIPLQFSMWTAGERKRKFYIILMVLLALGWVLEHLILGSIGSLHPYFRMSYSLVLVLVSINMINYRVIHEEQRLIRHPVFIICCGFIVFFTYQLVYEGVYDIVSNMDIVVSTNLNTAFSVINAFCNILYAVALIAVPRRNTVDWMYEKKEV